MTLASGMEIPLETIAATCRRFRVRELAVFGSAARRDFQTGSDVDLMVVFEAGFQPGFRWFELETGIRLEEARGVLPVPPL